LGGGTDPVCFTFGSTLEAGTVVVNGEAGGLATTLAAFVSGVLFEVTDGIFAVELAFRVGAGCRGVSGPDLKVFGASLDTADGV
jgi:hypothetical protein